MSTPNDTPRTDVLDDKLADYDWDEGYGELLGHARTLERELAVSQAEVRLLTKARDEREDWLIEELQQQTKMFPESAEAEVEIVIPELSDLPIEAAQWESRNQRVVIIAG